ncbi:MAG: mitochondrial fission ELM1 family protein [Hyphomicrobiaceae bacterium]
MAHQSPQHTAVHPLAGRSAWLITDGKMGMDVQVRGVADALGVIAQAKRVAPSGAYRLLAPWGPAPRRETFGNDGLFHPPWPDIAIATGRLSIPYLRALRKKAGIRTFSVYLQDPRMGSRVADLVWVPEHDGLRGTNVITTLTPPHSFSGARLAELRSTIPAAIAALPGPRIAVILGGKNGVYKYTDACDDRLKASLRDLAKLGASFMITPSRRTHERLLRQVREATADAPRILWDGNGENPYPHFLAHADLLVVTADSVNMCGEACATGKPVYIFTPSGGSDKFARFHNALNTHGATRSLPEHLDTIPHWSYQPIDAAGRIAAAIEDRWHKRKTMLGSLHQC